MMPLQLTHTHTVGKIPDQTRWHCSLTATLTLSSTASSQLSTIHFHTGLQSIASRQTHALKIALS